MQKVGVIKKIENKGNSRIIEKKRPEALKNSNK
jgi:hypothetical protein